MTPRSSVAPASAGMRVEEAWIPMPDGVRLAVNLFFPADAEPGQRFPPILEYLPYRKDDGLWEREHDVYSYVVARGYACAFVDIRGTGRSEGRIPDREYSEQELSDGEVVIAWLAAQPWSTGNVGMWGISWSGFNAIHMAMRRPPALRAILPMMATDDLFTGDIHYIDGCMHLDEWVLMMDVLNAMTPAPEYPLDDEVLANRFDTEPWLPRYLREQRDGPFWTVGSLDRRWDSIEIPVFHIGGWYDGYRDAVPRMIQHMPDTVVKGMVGPWNHTFPHMADRPGPAIEWRQEAVRWWDRWLKDESNGIEDEPRLALFVRDTYPSGDDMADIPGRWRTEDTWPPSRLQERVLHLRSDRSLGQDPGQADAHRLRYVPGVGMGAGWWWGELTPDQSPDDQFALVYETPPLDEDLEVTGMPKAVLSAEADALLAHWFARLSDVSPDGEATLVAGGGLNGAHRESTERPRALEPGAIDRFDVPMRFTSWVFPAGHRIRLAISNAQWPMIWPTPDPMTTAVHVGTGDGSQLILPVLPALPPEERLEPTYPAPSPPAPPPGVTSTGSGFPGPPTVERDEARGETTARWSGTFRTEYPWGAVTVEETMTYGVEDARPAEAWATGDAVNTAEIPGRRVVWRTHLDLRSDRSDFHYQYGRELLENGRLVRRRDWNERIPRDHQ